MGILNFLLSSRIEEAINQRMETSAKVWGTTAFKNTPPTFVSDFILEGAWRRDEMSHRGNMARRNAPAYNMTTSIAHNIFDDGFVFKDKKDPEKEVMQDVLKELERMEHLKYMSLALAGERMYGHTWLGVLPESADDLRVGDITPENGPRIAKLDFFTPETSEITEWSDIGEPTKIDVFVYTNAGKSTGPGTIAGSVRQRIPVNTEDCILFRTRPFDRSHEGMPVTYPVWNALVGLEMIFHAITTYSMKMGVGALIMTTKGAISTEDAAATKAMMEDLSVSRVAVVPGRAVEDLKYIGASGSSISFDAYIDAFMSQIAAGSKIPKDVLVGTSAGAITGSEVNSKALYAVIQGVQTSMEPYIRELVRRMGHMGDEYDIEWNVRYATDERMAAEIRVLNTQADEGEQRIKQMKEGNSPNDSRITVGMEEGPKDQDKKKNLAGAR